MSGAGTPTPAPGRNGGWPDAHDPRPKPGVMADTPSGSRKEHRREPSDCCPTERGICPCNPPCCNGGRLQQAQLNTQWRPAARDSTPWVGRAFTITCVGSRQYMNNSPRTNVGSNGSSSRVVSVFPDRRPFQCPTKPPPGPGRSAMRHRRFASSQHPGTRQHSLVR
jgi:hypothetical protein